MSWNRYLICCALGLLLTSPLAGGQGTPPRNPGGGSACVVAKQLGNSLDIAWVTGAPSVSQAIDQAKRKLRAKGFKYLFPQANSPLPHGWISVIKTRYKTYIGKLRTSYGCGFSARSAQQAEQRAVQDLQAFSWGWKPRHEYEVIESRRY